MNAAKAQLMGQREKLRQENVEVFLDGKSSFDAIRNIVASNIPFVLEKIDSAVLERHAQRLHDACVKQKKILADIAEIDKELE